jgi:hypothetical protein
MQKLNPDKVNYSRHLQLVRKYIYIIQQIVDDPNVCLALQLKTANTAAEALTKFISLEEHIVSEANKELAIKKQQRLPKNPKISSADIKSLRLADGNNTGD